MTFGKVKLKFSSIIKVQCRPNICFFFHLLLSAKKKVWHHDKSSNYGSWNHRVFMFLLRSLALGSEGCAALFYTSHAQCNKVKSVVEFKLRSSKLMLNSSDSLQILNLELQNKIIYVDPIDQIRKFQYVFKVQILKSGESQISWYFWFGTMMFKISIISWSRIQDIESWF